MKKIRIGNDFVFNWAIERGGLPEDLSSVLEKHLHLSVFGKRVELVEGVDYDITGNVIRIEVTPAIANIIGTYKAEFHYILPDNGLIDEDRKCAVDVDAFQIVAKTAQADDSTEFSMTSDMAIAFKGDKGDKGDSAYQVWLEEGNTGTEEDYFAYLRQPAIDAGASISELEGEIQVSEGLRVQAENEREQAESERQITIQEAVTATQEANAARDEANSAAESATNLVNSYATDLAAKELKANKQNSLAPDSTGTKFPTVDAVNAELRLTLTQQLANGDFSGGMTGWDNSLTDYTQTVTDGVYKGVRLNTSNAIRILRAVAEAPVNDNAYYFARVRVLQAGATGIFLTYAGTFLAAQSSPVANQWYFISQTNTFSNPRRVGIRVEYPTNEALAGYGIEVDYMGMINLTAIFGAGYEPTKSEMDILMQLIPNNYFEGTLSLTQKQTMNWVLKLIRQNRAAIIASGGTII